MGKVDNFPEIEYDVGSGIGDMSLTDLEAAAARMQECDDDFVAASSFDFEYEVNIQILLLHSGSLNNCALILVYSKIHSILSISHMCVSIISFCCPLVLNVVENQISNISFM